jgi:competence protein ComEC
MPHHRKKIFDVASIIALFVLIILDAAVWNTIFTSMTGGSDISPGIYFFAVTQGESILLALPGGVTALTDAGSDDSIVDDIQGRLPTNASPYIDLAIISDPQEANYEGYLYLLQHYEIGAFIYNGRADTEESAEWQKLMDAISAKHIPLITLGAGDRIRYGKSAKIDILSPGTPFAHSPDPDDTGLVQHITTPTYSGLLAADIGVNVENALLAKNSGTLAYLAANILKAPFPGLGTSAGDAFLHAVGPRVVVIEPGTKNSASQPTKAMLAHLASSTKATIASPKHGSFLLYNK